MKTIGRIALGVGWALCFLLFCATLDKVPDDPAVLKQLAAGHSLEYKHHVQPADFTQAGCTGVPVAVSPSCTGVPARDLEMAPPPGPPIVVRQAADSSPPDARA